METGTCSLRSVFKNGSCSNCPLLLMFFSLGGLFMAGFVAILIDFAGLYYRRRLDVAALRAMAQRMIDEDAGEHGLGDGGSPNPHAGVVPARGFDGRGLAAGIDCPSG